jgi:hypothetical protein
MANGMTTILTVFFFFLYWLGNMWDDDQKIMVNSSALIKRHLTSSRETHLGQVCGWRSTELKPYLEMHYR